MVALNLKIGLQQNSLGVEKIFLHGWIRDEIAVPQGPNGFCSVPIFHDEKSGYVLKRWHFAPAGEAGKARFFLKNRHETEFSPGIRDQKRIYHAPKHKP